jgi:predicted Zn finger-like uncharacterized protein
MKVTCPGCGHVSQIDASKIPEKGVQTKCRKCDARFLLTRKGAVAPAKAKKPAAKIQSEAAPIDPAVPDPTPPDQAASSETELYTCEKCRHKQHPSRACVYCGNPFPQFQGAASQTPDKAAAAKPSPPAASEKGKEAERIIPKPAIFPISAGDADGVPPWSVRCPFCDESIRELAKKCKHCGEFLDKMERAAAQSPLRIAEVFSGLIDFGFRRMITPELVKALYIVALALGGIGALATAFFAVKGGAYGAAAGSIVGYLLMVLFVRVYAELSMIVFKIEENTRRSRR